MPDNDHLWVQLSYTPIEVEVLDDGTLNIFITEEQEAMRESYSRYGCQFCNEPLTAESYGTECAGADIDPNQFSAEP